VDVRVGYNRLEALAEDLFGNPEGLIKSLRHFNCSENNLPELPNSICFLDPLLRLEADFNPLISPPPELLKGGLLQVRPAPPHPPHPTRLHAAFPSPSLLPFPNVTPQRLVRRRGASPALPHLSPPPLSPLSLTTLSLSLVLAGQVQEYLRVRMVRQRELFDLINENDFEYVT